MVILFYREQFFPAEHIDAGKPVPLGLAGQILYVTTPFTNEKTAAEHEALKQELIKKQYSAAVIDGNDKIQKKLRNAAHVVIDPRTFEELYPIGSAKLEVEIANSSPNFLSKVVACAEKTASMVTSFNTFVQGHPRLKVMVDKFMEQHPVVHTAHVVVSGAGTLLKLATEANNKL